MSYAPGTITRRDDPAARARLDALVRGAVERQQALHAQGSQSLPLEQSTPKKAG